MTDEKFRNEMAGIPGLEHAKRALWIALNGLHSVLLIGNEEATAIAATYKTLRGSLVCFVRTPCPCGHYADPRHECHCTAKAVRLHRQEFPQTDITIDVPSIDFDAMETAGVFRAANGHQILDKESLRFLRQCVEETGISWVAVQRVIAVAETIAGEDGTESVKIEHLSEAIQYRSIKS